MELEHFFQCPYCWEEISMIFDSSVAQQTYIEDCEVCCNPIEVSPSFEDGDLVRFYSQSIEQ
jgi:transcription elongation factor Elf1